MKKLMGNRVVCVGSFSGPDIEEGTFHEPETDTDVSHKSKTAQKCPCPPVESHEANASDDSNEDNEKDTGNNS
jgi:hypothetical protein